MLICLAVSFDFRALVVFLRRLVVLFGCLDFATDLIQMYLPSPAPSSALLTEFHRRYTALFTGNLTFYNQGTYQGEWFRNWTSGHYNQQCEKVSRKLTSNAGSLL